MRAVVIALTVVGALALAPAGTAARAPAPAKFAAVTAACSSVSYGGRSYVMYHRGVSCGYARYWVKRLNRTRRGPRGWRCGSGTNFTTGGGCSRGRRAFGWHPGD